MFEVIFHLFGVGLMELYKKVKLPWAGLLIPMAISIEHAGDTLSISIESFSYAHQQE